MRLNLLMSHLDAVAPLAHAEAWDNVGLLVGHTSDTIRRVLITIDLTHAVFEEALAFGAELIIAYHPTWFAHKKRLVNDDLVLRLARAGISLYSPHTALDACLGGTNDHLADAAQVPREWRVPLRPSAAQDTLGMGRVGSLAAPVAFGPWLENLKKGMGVAHALVAHTPELAALGTEETKEPGEGVPAPVRRVAVCAGAGDDLWQSALACGADTFVVGELRHHHALACAAQNLRVVALLHSCSERATLAFYAAQLARRAADVTFRVSHSDRDPYSFC